MQNILFNTHVFYESKLICHETLFYSSTKKYIEYITNYHLKNAPEAIK